MVIRRDRDDDRGGGRGRDRGGGGRGGRDRRDRDRDRDRDREDAHTAAPEYHDQLDGPVRGAAAVPEQTPDLVSDFPSLSGAPAKLKAPASKEQAQSWSNRSGAATASPEEFPSLPGMIVYQFLSWLIVNTWCFCDCVYNWCTPFWSKGGSG